MTMHAALNREAVLENGDAIFFADIPPVANDAAARTHSGHGGGYGARKGPNWIAIATIVGLHFAALFALVKLDIIAVNKPKVSNLVVFDIAEPTPPPAEERKPEPVVEKIVPQVVTPVAIVQTLAPPPPPIAVTTTPPPPKPVQAAPAPASPSPITVTNLDERRISGNPPRYPMESRRKKEQGTVTLRLVIGTDGRVETITVAQSSGFDRLDQAALDAVRGWRWQPILQAGEAVTVRGLLSIPFTLAPR